MFWIPICFIVLVFCLIRGVIDYVQTESMKSKADQHEAKIKAFEKQVEDENLEWEMEGKLEKDYVLRASIVRDFMGGGEEWSQFYLTTNAALRVLMAQHGKLPRLDARFGYSGGGAGNYRLSTPKRIHEMREEFLLALEDELNKNGVHTVLVAQFDRKNGWPTGEYESVRDHVKHFGYGTGNFLTKYMWAQCVEGGERFL